jgi:hypothetical protein
LESGHGRTVINQLNPIVSVKVGHGISSSPDGSPNGFSSHPWICLCHLSLWAPGPPSLLKKWRRGWDWLRFAPGSRPMPIGIACSPDGSPNGFSSHPWLYLCHQGLWASGPPGLRAS